MNVDDPYVAYCLDSAVATFGLALSAELNLVEGKNAKEIQKKQQRILDRWLGNPIRYREPMATRGGDKSSASEEPQSTEFSVRGID